MLALILIALTLDDRPAPDAAAVGDCLARVREVHGGAGPWAVVGYRMGERALHDLDRPRHSFAVRVTHRCPAEVQYSCVADGLQAATGASPGKLNLRVEEAPADAMRTVVRDEKTGRSLTFAVRPELKRSILDLPYDQLEAAGRRVAGLRDDEIFTVVRSD